MDISLILLQLQLISIIVFSKMIAFGFVNQDERKCQYIRSDKLFKIRCYDMNLKEVPRNLKSSVELLDLSFNRIRKLHRTSFQNYKSLKYLLLYENMIQDVEGGTFESLTSLQEVDLSNNALLTIPLDLFQLPSLRNLYVDSNGLRDLTEDLRLLETPINAPLEYLNIANCELKDLPNLGLLPKLWHINASSNPLTELNMNRFADMCNLKSIDLFKTSLTDCACQQVNSHLKILGVKTKFVPICIEALDQNICPLPYNATINSENFARCKAKIAQEKTRDFWLFTAGCFGGVILVILFVWFCIRRQRKRRLKKRRAAANRKPLVISPKNAINNHTKNTSSHKDMNSNRREDELLCCDTA